MHKNAQGKANCTRMHKPETKLIFVFFQLVKQLSFQWRHITGLLRFWCDVFVGSEAWPLTVSEARSKKRSLIPWCHKMIYFCNNMYI